MVNLSVQEKMKFVLRVGQILAENGATADKIMHNVNRAAAFTQIQDENFNFKVMPTVLFLNVTDGEKTYQMFRNYENRGVDMNIINLVNALTVKALQKQYSQKKFQDVLNKIVSQKKLYSHSQIILATGLFCGAFCFLFGGDLSASFYTAICSCFGKIFQIKSVKYGVNHFLAIAIAAFVATFLAFFANFLPTKTPWLPLIACSLFLIPGIPIMNAITESLGGFLLNGITRAYHSMLIAISIMAGIVFSTAICENVEGIDLRDISLSVSHTVVEIFFAGIIVSVAFCMFINAPRKTLRILGALGVIALIIKNFMIYELNFSTGIATFTAALFIGISAIMAKKYTHAPTQVLTVPAIISFVPGVLIYRFLSACVYIRYLNVEEFFYEIGFGIDAFQIIFAMTIGVTLPNLIANRLLKKI